MPRLVVYKSRSLRRNQRWRWRLVTSNGNIVAESGEGYWDRPMCVDMAKLVIGGDYKDASICGQ